MRRFSSIPALFAALLTLTACDHFAAAEATPSAQPQLTPATNDPCRVRLDPASTITVETLRAADGSCVPPSNLVVYRCDPSLDPPVASVDVAGARRRFLGGPYAVPLGAIPTDALSVGIAEHGRTGITRDNPRSCGKAPGGA